MTCTRRVALQTLSVGAIGCMAGCGGDGLEGGVPLGKAAMCGNNLCVNLAENPDLANVGAVLFFNQAAGRKIFVMRASATELRATSGICTHQQCTIEWDGERFECPCHGSQFSSTGMVLRGPAGAPLRTFDTNLSGDQLTVML